MVRVVMGGSDSTMYSTLTSSLERSFLCLGPGPNLYIALLYIYHRSILILGRTPIRAGRDPMFLSGTTQKTGLLGIRDSPPVPGDLGLASLGSESLGRLGDLGFWIGGLEQEKRRVRGRADGSLMTRAMVSNAPRHASWYHRRTSDASSPPPLEPRP